MQEWQLNNKTAETYFTSQFFDFTNNNDNSKIEDYDISQQYLKSEFSEKSVILRQMNEEYFMKSLQVYYKFCLYDTLYSWRKFNEIQIQKELRGPKNMTKVFVKVFYLLQKKIRSNIRKSLQKIINFTKQNDMKTYETPIVKGIKKLDQAVYMLNQKYFYNHSMKSKQFTEQGFWELKIFNKIVKNKTKIQNFQILLNKMSRQIALNQFQLKLNYWQRLLQKLEIFVGSLNLLASPIKRIFFRKFKEGFIAEKVQSNRVDIIESLQNNNYYNQNCYFQSSKIDNRIIDDQIDSLQLENTDYGLQIEFIKSLQCQLIQQLPQQVETKIELQQSNLNIANDNIIDKMPQKNVAVSSLSFSKQLKRKSSSLDRKNKLKFKNIPGTTPKKNYAQKNLQIESVQNIESNYLNKQKETQFILKLNERKMDLKFIVQKLNALESCISIQNSLNFFSRSSRNIITTKQTINLNPLKSHQLNFSFPDYFDISSYSDIPKPLILKIPSLLQKNKLQNYESIKDPGIKMNRKTFKTLKSGKSISCFEQGQNSIPQHSFKQSSVKISVKGPSNNENYMLSQQNQKSLQQQHQNPLHVGLNLRKRVPVISQRQSKKIPQQNTISSQKFIHFKSLQNKTSKSPFNDSKNKYLFPIAHQNKNNIEFVPRVNSSKRSEQYFDEYQSHPFQASVQKCEKAHKGEKSLDISKNNSLTFKTNRPMKKVKSPDRHVGIGLKNSPQKKQNKISLKPSKSKKIKEIKFQYVDSKNQTPNLLYYNNRTDNFASNSTRSIKSNFEREKSAMKIIGTKGSKRQK